MSAWMCAVVKQLAVNADVLIRITHYMIHNIFVMYNALNFTSVPTLMPYQGAHINAVAIY